MTSDTKPYDWIDPVLYDAFLDGLPGDVAFYVEQAKEVGSPVLELGCGTGRMLIPIAQAGVEVVGLDCSPKMLAHARKKVVGLTPQVQDRVSMVEGDMRNFSLHQRFRMAMVPFHTFQALLTPDDQRASLRCVRRHLLDGGLLVFDIFDPRLDLITPQLGAARPALRKYREVRWPSSDQRIVIYHGSIFDQERQRLEATWRFETLKPDGTTESVDEITFPLRYTFRYEMEHLLELCGFQIDALYGDFQRGPFRYGGEQVWIARKR